MPPILRCFPISSPRNRLIPHGIEVCTDGSHGKQKRPIRWDRALLMGGELAVAKLGRNDTAHFLDGCGVLA